MSLTMHVLWELSFTFYILRKRLQKSKKCKPLNRKSHRLWQEKGLGWGGGNRPGLKGVGTQPRTDINPVPRP